MIYRGSLKVNTSVQLQFSYNKTDLFNVIDRRLPLKMVARNLLPCCNAFQLEEFNDFIGN